MKDRSPERSRRAHEYVHARLEQQNGGRDLQEREDKRSHRHGRPPLAQVSTHVVPYTHFGNRKKNDFAKIWHYTRFRPAEKNKPRSAMLHEHRCALAHNGTEAAT